MNSYYVNIVEFLKSYEFNLKSYINISNINVQHFQRINLSVSRCI